MVRDFGSFAQGASVGAILAAVTLLAPSANADTEGATANSPVQITRTTTTSQGATRTTVRPNDGTGANAKVTGGDWGSMSVDVEDGQRISARSEEHTSELQSRPHISYAVFCLKKKTKKKTTNNNKQHQHESKLIHEKKKNQPPHTENHEQIFN